jgi:hypothetical protein
MKYRMGRLALIAVMAAPCVGSGQTDNIEFSNCQSASVVSPDGRWLLEASFILSYCPDTKGITKPTAEEAAKVKSSNAVSLHLESVKDGSRRPIPFDGYWGQAAWSPSGAAFFVNDHIASDETDAAIFIADSLRMIDIDEAIFHSDPSTRPYGYEHRYFSVLKWLDDRTALVQLCGHTSKSPAQLFNYRYRVSLDGSVHRVSRQVRPATNANADSECK